MEIRWSEKKNIPQILTILIEMVEFELKIRYTKFCALG